NPVVSDFNLRGSERIGQDRRSRSYLDRLDEFFWIYDPRDRRFIYVGAGFTQIWEQPRTPLYDSHDGYFAAIHPEDRERVQSAFCSDGSGGYDESYRICRPDGTQCWVRDRAFPLLEKGERFSYVAGLATDLSDLVGPSASQDGAAGRRDQPPGGRPDRRESKYRGLFEGSVDARLLLDLRGYVIEANAAAAALLDRDRAQLLDMHFSSFWPSEVLQRAVQKWERVAAGESIDATLPMVRADGSRVSVEFAAGLVGFGPENVVEACVRDAAPRAQMARQLEAAKAQLAQAQKMELVGQLAGGIAHDFNNLLSVIMSCAHFIDVELPEGSHLRDDTEKIVHASESAASLVHRLLAFAREEVNADEIVEPGRLLEQVQPLLERTLPAEISLVMRCDDDLGEVEMSSVEFEQVVMNLGVNARDAMAEGGELTIEASKVDGLPEAAPAEKRSRPSSYVRIRVRDTGTGMDEAIRARIFEPFFTTKSKGYGTGLGLATVADLVERNHGFIRVDSAPGVGTVFELYFPQASPLTATDIDKATIPIPATGDERILVLDDDPEVRQLVRRILETGGYTILMADDTDHALEMLEQGLGVDLFVTDILLPDDQRPTSVERVHAIRPNLPVLHTSSFVDDVQTRQIVRDQEAFFLAKPITPNSLLSKVREVFRQSKPGSGA
ncbi:MAG: ATP-binding protein, partial [Persicimonas sp.]